MPRQFTAVELEAYLDEALDPQAMAAVEGALREQPELAEQLAAILSRRDAGVHSLGEIWRRHRISCPSRQTLGSYLLDVLDEPQARYLTFHLEIVGCRFCQANLDDLQRALAETKDATVTRRKKYFQSSAGYLGQEQ